MTTTTSDRFTAPCHTQCPAIDATTHLLLGIILLCCSIPALQAQQALSALIDIDTIGYTRLSELQNNRQLDWWVELDDRLLIATDRENLQQIERSYHVLREYTGVETSQLFFLGKSPHFAIPRLRGRQLAEGGRFSVLQLDDPASADELLTLPPAVSGYGAQTLLLPFQADTILARQLANSETVLRKQVDPAIQELVDQIDIDRWFADVEMLAGWNRWTFGTEILQARDWLREQFSALGLTVTTPDFAVGANTAYNVMATLPGNQNPDQWLVVGAHYDAISENSALAAPGAEDNASGCAGVLEIARIFTASPPPATIIFICFSAEEQGLFGSADHVSELIGSGDAGKVSAVLTMDMIAYSGDADLDCLLESSAAFQSLIDTLAAAAAGYTSLRIVTSTFPFGSDHVSYIDNGIPALLSIENDWDEYPHYHRSSDTIDNISPAMGQGVLQMNVAALAQLMGVQQNELFSDQFETP